MFLPKPLAEKENIKSISDLWRIADKHGWPKFKDAPMNNLKVGMFKKHMQGIFESINEFAWEVDKHVYEKIPSFLDDYLADRFLVPHRVSNKIRL